MNLDDLRVFATVARSRSLVAAAVECHQTASALSKALRRLEAALGTPLFDRSSKQLLLNRAGLSLLPRALSLLSFAEQTKSEVLGSRSRFHCRVGAPAIVLWRFGEVFARLLIADFADCTLSLKPMFEDQALAALANGEVDFACVTGAVVTPPNKHWQASWQADKIGSMTMVLTAGLTHPLASARAVSTAKLVQHDFVCPSHSLFCGVNRGAHSDGWREDALPRPIRYWIDDIQVLLSFVKSGKALAYLPEFALADDELVRVELSDCPYTCTESIFVVHAPTQASGWQQRVLAGMLAQEQSSSERR
jgi:DNA-binding transcriptional LysR family regulator